MKNDTLPIGTEQVAVNISGNSLETEEGRMWVKRWTPKERTARAFKKTAKIVGTVFACSFVGLFVHLLLLIIVPTLALTLVASGPLFFRFQAQEASFFWVDGTCPYCKKEGRLRPYLDSEFKKRVTIQCPACGQTAHASRESDSDFDNR